MIATAFDSDAPSDARRPVIRRDAGELEMVELTWGLKPKEVGERPFRFVRSEGRTFESHRCLIPASEFHVKAGGRAFQFSLRSGDWFYLAGIWRPASGGWPESFAIITVQASAEVQRYQDRQGAILFRSQRMEWLDGSTPEAELFHPLPAGELAVAEQRGRQGTLL